MKKTIKIAISKTVVNSVEKEIDFPEIAKYYDLEGSDDIFSKKMFAIIPKHKNMTNPSYRLVYVERNTQTSTDFIPHDDCNDEYWLDNKNNRDISLRKKAMDILSNYPTAYMKKEISDADFERLRTTLLDMYKSL